MNQLSERDKIIMNLKSEIFDIQQNAKNIHKLEEANNEYQNKNQQLNNEKNKLEFLLQKTKEETSKQIEDLKLEINNLNEELNNKKQTNIQLFIKNQSLEKKIDVMTKQNNKLSQEINCLISQNSENKNLIEKYLQKIKIYENNEKNDRLQKTIKELKEKYDKNIISLQNKVNELQTINKQLNSDNKNLIKIYKMKYNNKEKDNNDILSPINSNLITEYYEKENQNSTKKINNSNSKEDLMNINKFIYNKKNRNIPLRNKISLTQKSRSINAHVKNIDYNEDDISTEIRIPKILRTEMNYTENDINKTYIFKKIKNKKNFKKKFLLKEKINNKENFDENMNNDLCTPINNIKINEYFNELIKTQKENIMLKKQILNMAKQIGNIIDEIDNIVKISGMNTIDVTSEGIKHLEQLIYTNRDLLEKYLNEVKQYKI